MDDNNKAIPLSRNATGQGLLLASLALLCLGVVMVYSASLSLKRVSAGPASQPASFASLSPELKHAILAGSAAVTLCLLWRLDYRLLARGRRWPILSTALLAGSLVLAGVGLFPPPRGGV